MIYLDTSVALAQILSEDRRPRADFWGAPLVSSRLLQYEVWTRLHGSGQARTHEPAARHLLGLVNFVEMTPEVLMQVVDGFSTPLRTLDALHLATMRWLMSQRIDLELATYDTRLASAARKAGIRAATIPA